MDWTPQITPHTSPLPQASLVSQPSDAADRIARPYRNLPSRLSRRDGEQGSSRLLADKTTQHASIMLSSDYSRAIDSTDEGYLTRAFDPLSAIFDLDQVVDGFPTTSCPPVLHDNDSSHDLPDTSAQRHATNVSSTPPMFTSLWNPVEHHVPAQAGDSLSWLDLDALVQATQDEAAQTDNASDNSWFIDMLLNNNDPSPTPPSDPVPHVSHEEVGLFPESAGILDGFVKDLQAALLESETPAIPAEEALDDSPDASRPDDRPSEDRAIDLDWWYQWINEDADQSSVLPTSFSVETPWTSSAYADDEPLSSALTDYNILDDFAEMTISPI